MSGSVLRRAHVEVLPDTKGFDPELTKQLRAADPGGKAGKQIGGQLNRALKRFDLDPIDVKADPKKALAAIDLTQRKLRELSHDAATVEVKVRTEKALGELARFKKQLGNADEAGQGIGKSLAEAFSKPQLLAAAAGLGVILSPVLGAAVSGAIIGGAGVGGVIGGLLLVSKDARVQAAGKALGTRLLASLQQDSAVFVQPVLAAIDQMGDAFDRLQPKFKAIFANSAQFVGPLTDGLVGFLNPVIDGFDKLVAKAAPVIEAIRQGFTQVGRAIGDVFKSLSDNGTEAALALSIVFNGIAVSIRIVGSIVNGLTEAFGFLVKVADKLGFLSDTGKEKLGAFKDATDRATGSTAGLGASFQKAADDAAVLKAQQDGLKAATDAVKAAQDGLKGSLESLGGSTSHQGQVAAALTTAMDNLYGAAIRNTDANEAYQASVDALSGSVSSNGRTLNINTAAGRANRDALEALLASNGELYVSNIAAGVSEDSARKKHDNRTAAIKEEARRLGLNKAATQDLINTYGKIPKAKTTDLLLKGVNAIAQALKDLYVFQRALADGIPIASEVAKLKNEKGPAKRFGGLATGGQVGGWSPNSTADNIPALLTAKEWVHPVDAVDYYGPQIMGAIQKREVPREVLSGFAGGALGKLGDLPIFAAGGQVGPIDVSKRWPFFAAMGRTHVMSRAEAAAKIPIGAGPGGAFVRAQDGKPYIWADAGPGGYDCSGIVSAVYNVLHGRNPYSHTFSTGSLPGHWFTKPGIGGPLTAAWSNPGESPASSTTGHMMGMVNGLTFESSGSRGVHLGASTRRLTDFAHIAHYNRGGQVPFGSYDSGGYLPPGLSLAHNGTGRPEPVGGGDTFVFHFSGPVASKRAMEDLVVGAVKRARQSRRLP